MMQIIRKITHILMYNTYMCTYAHISSDLCPLGDYMGGLYDCETYKG